MTDRLPPGGFHGGAGVRCGLGDVAGEVEGLAEVDVEVGAAQRRGDDTGELLHPPAGDDPSGTGVPERDDGRAGAEREAGQTGAEGAGSEVRGVSAAGESALGVDHHDPAGGEGPGRQIQRRRRATAAPVDRYVTLAGEPPAEEGDLPQPRGREDDRLDAQPVQRGQDETRIGESGVVRRDDAAGCDGAGRPGGHRQTAEEGDDGTGEGAEHVLLTL